MMPRPSSVPEKTPVVVVSTAASSTVDLKPPATITLTYTTKSPQSMSPSSMFPRKQPSSQQRLVNELKSISEAMKSKAALEATSETKGHANNEIKVQVKKEPKEMKEKVTVKIEPDILINNNADVDTSKKNGSRKKRRKPLLGNEKDRRPMNGFMLFAKEMRVELTRLFPGKDNRYYITRSRNSW